MKQLRIFGIALLAVMLLLGACTDDGGGTTEGAQPAADAGDDNPEGRTVKIAFSAPGADHGWLAAITENARAEADKYDDVELVLNEGTNDSAAQASQVETLVNQDPDVLVILPHEGDALTPAAQDAMAAGIPVVNLDREFSSPSAYRTWIGGDNYGIGKSAGDYFAQELDCKGNVVEIQGLAGISVTELRTKGFADAIKQCDGGIKVIAQQPADFLPDKGLEVMEAILQSEDQIDAVYTHDDDMAMGVVSAIQNAGREGEMFVTGAGGSADAMKLIQEGDLYKATFLYNPSMSASAIRLARLIALGAPMGDLVEPEVPSYIQLPATTVTQENVDDVIDLGY
ncbi:MAG TPA: substrate-binding domain-containing protein [Actinomycetota bacterium]|nr:substrate-binding domain-containing protein [Actinomycetota bacterium]